MLGRMCYRCESVAVAEASGRDPLDWLAGSARWRSIGPQLLQSWIVLESDPWCMDHMCEATVHGHLHLCCLMLDGRGEVSGSHRRSCPLQKIGCSRYRTGHGVDEQ